MSDDKIYAVPAEWKQRGFIDDAKYKQMYAALDQGSEDSGASRAFASTGSSRSPRSRTVSFKPGNVSIKWFEDGTPNVAHNCIDRHLATRADQTAIIWEGDDPKESKQITYGSSMPRSAGSPTSCAIASRRATASRSTCR